MIAGFIETSDNQTVLLASDWPLARSRDSIGLMGSRTLLALRFASSKQQKRYMIDGFTDTAGPEISF